MKKNKYYIWFLPEIKFNDLYKVVGEVNIYNSNTTLYKNFIIKTNDEFNFYELIKNKELNSENELKDMIDKLNNYNLENKMKTMKEKVESYLNLQNDLRVELKEYVKDKSIPLDERWELFIMCELGNNEPFYEDFSSFNYEEFFIELELSRNEVVTSECIIDLLDTEVYGEYLYTTLDDVKEEILEKFINSFKYDW